MSSPKSSALGVASTSSMNPARASDDGKTHPPHVDVDIVVARTQASARDARADDDVHADADALGDVIDASASFERANARARVAARRADRARVVIGPTRVVVVVIATDEDESRNVSPTVTREIDDGRRPRAGVVEKKRRLESPSRRRDDEDGIRRLARREIGVDL